MPKKAKMVPLGLEFQAKRFLLDSQEIEESYKALVDTFGKLNHEVVQFSVDVLKE